MSNRLLRDGRMVAEAAELEPVETGARAAEGSPLQQCWQVLNFHERRLNKIDATFKLISQAVEELRKDVSDKGREAGHNRSLARQVAGLEGKLNRLHQTVTVLSATAARATTNAVQLEVTEG